MFQLTFAIANRRDAELALDALSAVIDKLDSDPQADQRQLQLPLDLPTQPPPGESKPVVKSTREELDGLPREELDRLLKEVASQRGGVIWLRKIFGKRGVSRASELSDEQLRGVLADA